MIFIVTAIELDRLDAGCGSLLCNQLTNLGGSVTVAPLVDLDTLITRAGADQGLTSKVIDHLATEMFE